MDLQPLSNPPARVWQVYCSHRANSPATRVQVYNERLQYTRTEIVSQSLSTRRHHRPAITRRCLHKVCTKIAQGPKNIGT